MGLAEVTDRRHVPLEPPDTHRDADLSLLFLYNYVRILLVRVCCRPFQRPRGRGDIKMRVTSKGQVTIPADIREKAGLLPNTEVEFSMSGRKVILRKVGGQRSRGTKLVAAMRGRATRKMSTDQIMALTRGE